LIETVSGAWFGNVVVYNGVGHINKVKLRRARLVLELGTTSGGRSTIPVFIEANSAWPSSVGRRDEHRRLFRPPLVKKRRVLH